MGARQPRSGKTDDTWTACAVLDQPEFGLGVGGGPGFGIVQQIADAHGGHIEVSSGAQNGTLFTFTLKTP